MNITSLLPRQALLLSLTFTFGFEGRSARDGTEKELFQLLMCSRDFQGLGFFLVNKG